MGFLSLILCFIATVLITPWIKKLAIRIGAVDKPNNRKVHVNIMPRLGGLAIFIGFMIGFAIFHPSSYEAEKGFIIVGAILVTIIGVLDDRFELSAKVKFAGQLVAAIVAVMGGVRIDFINLPFGGEIEFGIFSIPLTIIWIVGITNAINLIDGLDGLAAGVSAIALLTISGLAITMGDMFVATMGLMLFGSTLGFLVYNFYPAKIFMGDTGALFLGYMVGVLSVLGFKNVTIFSLIVPIIILGVPILDTFFAIIRRIINKKPLSAPDKLHLHHCLLNLGYSHRKTVVLIYIMSSLFSIAAVIFTQATLWGSSLTLLVLLIMVELTVEITGLISDKYRPILNFIEKSRG